MITDVNDKVYFAPGQRVTLKQDIPNKPIMLVYRVERNILKNKEGSDLLRGIKVRWFTENGFMQEAVFSTKDLVLVD